MSGFASMAQPSKQLAHVAEPKYSHKCFYIALPKLANQPTREIQHGSKVD